MCGISGKAYLGNQTVRLEHLAEMTKKIRHRGPDNTDYFISKDKKVGLGHNRLSIIDLSKLGNQPMHYRNRYVIVANNEIYNFQKIKGELLKEGYEFKSKCDTEVILALYAKYKEKCVDFLRGMYAFCIYDSYDQTLFLARDRIGKKPLKYFYDGKVFIFASELKAILTQPEVSKIPDYEAIQEYLTFGYVPAPKTGFVGIKKLEPGSFIKLNLKNKILTKKRYWEPKFNMKRNLSEKEWVNEILNKLEESTRIRLMSEVPLGAFLSGGVDSSAVVAAMAAVSPKPIDTFTIDFHDKKLSERKFAKNISRKYKTNYHELTAKPESIDLLPYICYQYEEPFSDNSAVVSMMVSRLARKYIKVVLNGDGGDENFAGYPNRYLRLKRDVDLNFYIKTLGPLTSIFLGKFQILKSQKFIKIRNFLNKTNLPIHERFASYNEIFSSQEIKSIYKNLKIDSKNGNTNYNIIEKEFENFDGQDLKDAGLKFDLKYFLPDQLLAKMDIATMSVGLEARSPLLDHEFVDMTATIPFNLKIKNGETKYIFKKALEKIVPKENLYRSKIGFTIPLNNWFKGELNSYASSVLLSKNAFIKEIFDLELVKQMIYDNNKTTDFGPKIWSLMALELWHKAYFV